ncbi:MAG: glutathione S-transferase [Proteobacteria bacterium]|nr:MAG: glutathione S-transferase [Pseudomonadota bacterium]
MTKRTLAIGDKRYSSWSLRPWLLLKMAGIPFQEACIKLRQPTTLAECLRYSPTGKVPVLLDGALTIWDTLAIAEYVAETWPEKQLWPADRAVRARARSVVAEMHSGFADMRREMAMDCISVLPRPELSEGATRDVARVQEIWQSCREAAQGGPFLFGAFTIADAFFAPVATRFVTYQIPMTGAVQAYADTILSLPAMQEWIAAATQE